MTPGSRDVPSRLLLFLTCAPLWGGCAALGTMDTADTVERGRVRWNIHGWVQGADDGRNPEYLPQVAMAVRAGWWTGDGAPVACVGVEVEDATLRGDAAAAGARSESGGQLVLGLHPTLMRFQEDNEDPAARTLVGLGFSLGYAFPVSSTLRIMPEVALLKPLSELTEGHWRLVEGTRPCSSVWPSWWIHAGEWHERKAPRIVVEPVVEAEHRARRSTPVCGLFRTGWLAVHSRCGGSTRSPSRSHWRDACTPSASASCEYPLYRDAHAPTLLPTPSPAALPGVMGCAAMGTPADGGHGRGGEGELERTARQATPS